MAKRKSKNDSLEIAKRYSALLLFQVTSGNMGKQPETPIKGEVATFGEKRGLLDSLIKIAILDKKGGGEDSESGFELIRNKLNDGGKNRRGGNSGGESEDITSESLPDDPPTSTGTGTEEEQDG